MAECERLVELGECEGAVHAAALPLSKSRLGRLDGWRFGGGSGRVSEPFHALEHRSDWLLHPLLS